MAIDQPLQDQLIVYQRNEITEYHIYRQLAKTIQSPDNKQILKK